MVQSSTGNPYDSAGMAYKLITLKVCLLESSLFRLIFNRLKYSFLSADLVVLSIVRFCPSICIVGLIPVILVLHQYGVDVFHMNNFSTLNGEPSTFVNAEAHSSFITEFIDDSYH